MESCRQVRASAFTFYDKVFAQERLDVPRRAAAMRWESRVVALSVTSSITHPCSAPPEFTIAVNNTTAIPALRKEQPSMMSATGVASSGSFSSQQIIIDQAGQWKLTAGYSQRRLRSQ